MEKGTRVTITGGKDGVGKSGLVFWSGPSKFGAGTRLGVKLVDGESVWCAATDVVRESGPAAPALPGEAEISPSEVTRDFEFFCRHPDDWFEGANMGHLISFAFVDELDEDAERAIADQFAGGEISFANVSFSGRVMKFDTGGYGLTFLAKVEAFARRLHVVVAIADVVFHGIREGVTGYPHPPVASADMGLSFGCPRPVDLDAPAWSKGRAFAAHLEAKNRVATDEAHSRRTRERIDKALAKQKEGPVQIREATRPDAKPPDSSGFRLAPAARVGAPPCPGDHPLVHARAVARVFDGRSYNSSKFAVIDEGKRVEFEVGMPVQRLSVFPDGANALIASSGLLGRMNLSTGEVTPLPSPNLHETFKGVAALAEGYWAVLTGAALYVFDSSNVLVVLKKLKGSAIATFAEGYGIGVWKGEQFTAFRFVHGKLKQLTKFDYAPSPMAEIEDALYFGTSIGDLALIGAHADIATERTRTPRKSKAKAIACSFLSWVSVQDEPLPRIESADEVVLPLNVVADRTASSPSGEWVAFQNGNSISVFDKSTNSVSHALPACGDFFMNDDGHLVAVGFGQVMWRHAPTAAAKDAKEWPGKRYTLRSKKGRASYLHDHDLVFFFPEETSHPPTPFACHSCIYSLWPLVGLRDVFERDGEAYFRWSGRTMQVRGLLELARRFEV